MDVATPYALQKGIKFDIVFVLANTPERVLKPKDLPLQL